MSLVSKHLQVAGYSPIGAYGGQEALDSAREFRPDVALLDIGMPKITGYEAALIKRQQTIALVGPMGLYGPAAATPGKMHEYLAKGAGTWLGKNTMWPLPGAEPMKSGLAISDLLTGMYATTAILAALERRNVTGRGQYIDMSLLETAEGVSPLTAGGPRGPRVTCGRGGRSSWPGTPRP